MILFWFLIGILFIVVISRYNESDNLFWKLFISFIGGFAACVAVHEYISNKKQDKVEYVTQAPTQALNNVSHIYCVLADNIASVTNEEKSSAPVSKEFLCYKNTIILSKVYAFTRDQPLMYFDTS